LSIEIERNSVAVLQVSLFNTVVKCPFTLSLPLDFAEAEGSVDLRNPTVVQRPFIDYADKLNIAVSTV
jgi:hypothetical protein